MKLTPANHNFMSRAIVTARQSHHLSTGWVPSQSWYIRDNENMPIGEAQIVVTGGGSPGCVGIIHIYDRMMEVVLCKGLIDALERIGYNRTTMEVV